MRGVISEKLTGLIEQANIAAQEAKDNGVQLTPSLVRGNIEKATMPDQAAQPISQQVGSQTGWQSSSLSSRPAGRPPVSTICCQAAPPPD